MKEGQLLKLLSPEHDWKARPEIPPPPGPQKKGAAFDDNLTIQG
jgi:hypothetical protein